MKLHLFRAPRLRTYCGKCLRTDEFRNHICTLVGLADCEVCRMAYAAEQARS